MTADASLKSGRRADDSDNVMFFVVLQLLVVSLAGLLVLDHRLHGLAGVSGLGGVWGGVCAGQGLFSGVLGCSTYVSVSVRRCRG